MFNNLAAVAIAKNDKCTCVKLIFIYLALIFLAGCTTAKIGQSIEDSRPEATEAKHIFVFMDGTTNNQDTETNVYRLYKIINDGSVNNANIKALYIEGVGNAKTPISQMVQIGLAFGMEERILEGYKFITQHYRKNKNDKIYIFGFSRGAHTARSLAGLISYAGVPTLNSAGLDSPWSTMATSGWNIGNKILEFTREHPDNDNDWKNWKRGDNPILASSIKKEITTIFGNPLNIEVQPAEIEFLGVWDTVPGSQGIDYFEENKNNLACKQPMSSTSSKQRYQIDSYPPIHHIAHAVSKDEKRSQFIPLFLCSKIINEHSVHNENLTKLDEVVFPGVHADVGGGYSHKNNQLPNISLKWMIEKLEKHVPFLDFNQFKVELKSNPAGLANLSISDKTASTGSSCMDRELPEVIISHDSIATREAAETVPWLYYDKPPTGDYPEQTCISMVDPMPIDENLKKNVLCINQSNIKCSHLGYK